MATSQFCSVCMAHDSIRACRALLLASHCAFSRSFLQGRAMPVVYVSFGNCSGCGPGYGPTGPSFQACRALSSIGSSSKSKKPAPFSQNPRDEIRRLDDEIRRLEKERRSVGKSKGADSFDGGRKGTAPHGRGASSRGKNVKLSSVVQNAKFASSAGSSGGLSARALARYEQENAEEEEDSDLEEGEDDENDDAIDDDDEKLEEEFSSDAEMQTESLDADKLVQNASNSASSVLLKPNSESAEVTESSQRETEGPEVRMSENVDSQSGPGIKHPWNEWNDFYDVLAEKNYFKDVLPDKFSMEGEGYLRFQSSAPMKRAILEFSRERDDIIRFLTKKHIKTVVTVGCPSTDRKVVNACKRLRVLCEIPEDEVCEQCKLKTFCTRAFAAPSPDLMAETVDVARVLYSFALNASPIAESQVSYPINVVKSACHLVNEIVQLSAYPKDPGLPALKSRLPVKPPVIEKGDINSNHRTGDWNCPVCNFKNFAKNRQCRECGTLKGGGKQLEPGDWECPECTFVNFRRNRDCRECSTPRPLDASGDEPSVPGEWKCPECHFVNFSRNTECRKCSMHRPKGIKLYNDEDLEPGDWLCPECNFKNFKRNKKCKECGAVSPDQGKRDDRWGLRKSISSGGWGSTRGMPSVPAKSGASRGRMQHEEWTPDLSRKTLDDSDDLEEDADLVFGVDTDEDDEAISSYSHQPVNKTSGKKEISQGKESVSRTRTKRETSQLKEIDDELPSDFDLSDFDDLPKTSLKKSGRKSKESEDVEDDEDDEDDDDNDMAEELSEDERSESKAGSKVGRSLLEKWDDDTSDDDDLPSSRTAVMGKPVKDRVLSNSLDDNDDDDDLIHRASNKGKLAKGRGFSGNWDDTDDDDEDSSLSKGAGSSTPAKSRGSSRKWADSDEGFSDDDDIGFGGHKKRGASAQEGSKFGIYKSQRDGSLGRFQGRGRGERHDRGGFGRHSSRFSDSDDDKSFTRHGARGEGLSRFALRGNGRGQRYGRNDHSQGPGRGESNNRGGFGRRSSNFSESDDDGGFASRGRGRGRRGYVGRGLSRGRGFRRRGRGERGGS